MLSQICDKCDTSLNRQSTLANLHSDISFVPYFDTDASVYLVEVLKFMLLKYTSALQGNVRITQTVVDCEQKTIFNLLIATI